MRSSSSRIPITATAFISIIRINIGHKPLFLAARQLGSNRLMTYTPHLNLPQCTLTLPMLAQALRFAGSHPFMKGTPIGTGLDFSLAMLEHTSDVTKRYGKREWGIDSTIIHGRDGPREEKVEERAVLGTPFCKLLNFAVD